MPPAAPPSFLAVVGATATGKSRLAMALAERLGGEIVNADALQVYRGFDIGTAKPEPAERERVRHHLIDVLDPDERYSAGEFARRARAAIADVRGRGGLPIVVGGSGLYLRALISGISPIPPGDPAVREQLRERLEAEGLPALAAELARRDPETAARLAPGDTQRVLRALEVAAVTGRPLSAWIARQPFGKERTSAIAVGLTLPRALLYDEIAGRVARMLERGWVREVESLLGRGLDPSLPAFQAIGYRQLVLHVQGEWSLDRAASDTIQATRRFAKRQETWFRKEPVTWFAALAPEERFQRVLDHVQQSGVGRANA
ncbi:MAG TPA: tRNA (adenosine(37)-N6)-dimethylallyltransferase MiaA [Thermoanaerobaculia bacterium]|nr:tRNA (adenosine(37)-N6)-dimethylallyltransferase MiaA [Thermoanaerobaculia bacterium]